MVKSFDAKDCQALLILDAPTHHLACGTKQHPHHKVTHHMKEIVVCLHQNIQVATLEETSSFLASLKAVCCAVPHFHTVFLCSRLQSVAKTVDKLNLTKICCNSSTYPRRTSAEKHCGRQVYLKLL